MSLVTQQHALKKELGLRDLVLTQIVFVVGTSWVGTGQNLPISAEQIQHVLGSEQVKELAAKAGISPEAASSHLAQLLPMLVDKLTPNGQVPQTSSMLEEGMGMLKNLGLGKTGTDS